MSIFKFLDNIENDNEPVVRQNTTTQSRPTRNVNTHSVSQDNNVVRGQEKLNIPHNNNIPETTTNNKTDIDIKPRENKVDDTKQNNNIEKNLENTNNKVENTITDNTSKETINKESIFNKTDNIKYNNNDQHGYSHVKALKEKAKKNQPQIEQKPIQPVQEETQPSQNNALIEIFNKLSNNAQNSKIKNQNNNGNDNFDENNEEDKVLKAPEPHKETTNNDVSRDKQNDNSAPANDKAELPNTTENSSDDEEDEEDEDDIDLEGMKRAFSNMYTNVEIAPVSKSEKYRQMREEMEAKRKGKKPHSSNIIADKLNSKKSYKSSTSSNNKPPVKTTSNNTEQNIDVSNTKPVEKKEIVTQFSDIVALTTTRPIEIAYDLSCRFLNGAVVRFNKYAKNSDFAELINKNASIKYLDISCCNMLDDFSPLLKLEEIEQLDISGCRNFSDLSLLSNMKKLKVLNLGLLNIESIDNLPDFPDLEVLSLKLLKIKDIKILAKYPKLHDLVLWCCSSIVSLDGIEGLTELRMLDLDSCTGIKTLEPIKNLYKLVHLNLNFLKIEDLSPIQNLTNIESFAMEFSPLALTEQNLSYFEKLVKMKFLGLRNRLIRKLDYFKNMTQMSDLELGGNIINDLRPIEDMVELKTLNLSTNSNLLDISFLHKMVKLQKLNLSGTSTPRGGRIEMIVGDLSVVKELKSLTSFASNFNKKLRDISPLKYCANLEEFSANNCLSLADISPLRFCTKLKSISIENCVQIRDMSFFKYLTELSQINISKTSVDRLLMSDWTRLYSLGEIKDSSTNVLINNIIVDSLQYRKKVAKVIKSTIKEEDNK